MNRKIILISLIVLSTAATVVYAQTKSDTAGLRIHLPREIIIEGSTPTLGQVAILRGSEPMTTKASDITLGHLSTPDQDLVIERKVILSRLACSGINASDISLTGAEEVVVRRRHESVAGKKFVDHAADFLTSNLPDKSICQFDPVRLPDNLVIPGSAKTIELASQLVSLRGNQCKVRTTAVCDGETIASRDTVFLCKYRCHKVIAKTPIAEGSVLSEDNITIEEGICSIPEPANWTPPYGQIARRSFDAQSEIELHMVSAPAPQIVLKRNQTVAIKINRPGFVASATGKALEDGTVGEYIKVKNVDSQKIIMAKVIEDGTVEPIF